MFGRRRIELKSIVSAIPGRNVSGFGTVRPRLQIPGPRPILVFRIGVFRRSMADQRSNGGRRLSEDEVRPTRTVPLIAAAARPGLGKN
jgi:hypothetical protein